MEITNEEIGQFLGGLLTYLVLGRADRLGEDLTETEWERQRPALIEQAYEQIVQMAVAEPLKSKLLAHRADFIAHGLKLN